MKKTYLIIILLCLIGSTVFAADVVVPANAGCRTQLLSPTANRHDNSKLSIRADGDSNKSWIKFDLSAAGVNLSKARAATLTLTTIEAESGTHTFNVSAVNDDYRVNIAWGERDITWNNAPGNDIVSQTNPNPAQTALMGTINTGANPQIGASFKVDVLSAIRGDTDGIVQFILHNSSTLMNMGTWDHATAAYRPYLTITPRNAGADYPVPANATEVETDLATLAWQNPDPNKAGGTITCTVYLGTDPNRPLMDKKTLAVGASSIAINAANFPKFGKLVNNTKYYWAVDCVDTTAGLITGETWSFTTNNNLPPEVNAGGDQGVWLGKSGVAGQEVITLTGTTKDDGLPVNPGVVTVLWTQTMGPAVTINSATAKTATATATQTGTYVFHLEASDGQKTAGDDVTVYVGTTACNASHMMPGTAYNRADENEDCIVDLIDLQLFIGDWLGCTDVLTNCAR